MFSKLYQSAGILLAQAHHMQRSYLKDPAEHIMIPQPLPQGCCYQAAAPTVQLDSAIITGRSSGSVSEFLGIPYAQPPVGNRRFRLPEPLPSYSTAISAEKYGRSCPSQDSDPSPVKDKASLGSVLEYVFDLVFGILFPGEPSNSNAEDCLTVNVVTPSAASTTSKLPVVVWIYGGGFTSGSTSTYDGSVIVKRSIDLGQPIIYVSMNYRVAAYGFLAGQEVKDAGVGNLGLQDQRLALRWVQKYISAFGGDPSKVTIWGESAGGISVALQMVTNGGNTEGLFRAGFMQSGAPIPVGDITHGQKYYDSLVRDTGCANANVSTLDCLRQVDYDVLQAAIANTPSIFDYQSLSLAWVPRVDGVFLKDNPQKLVQQGSVARIPFINGNCDDEGTFFSFSTLNITTTVQLEGWIRQFWFPKISDAEMKTLLELYPSDIVKGSPYDTGILNALTPQFKRIASFQGDGVFQAPRRFFLEYTTGKQPVWSYISKRLKGTPYVGAAHGTDILNVYGPGDLTDYLVHFVNDLDPNGSGVTPWPEYTLASPQLLRFSDGLIKRDLQLDDYRVEEMKYLTKLSLENPL